jgi:4-hydroxy-3-polyprenylbenzoate decarboxylase
MARVTRAGAVVLPAAPGFYHRPREMDDLINHLVGKILDTLGVSHRLFRRWSEGTEE